MLVDIDVRLAARLVMTEVISSTSACGSTDSAEHDGICSTKAESATAVVGVSGVIFDFQPSRLPTLRAAPYTRPAS